jgi:F-type H+-transporting ATPase subunit a
MEMNPKVVFNMDILGHPVEVTSSVVTQWFFMAVIIILVVLLTRNVGKIPTKMQSVLEMIVTATSGLVGSNMGKEYKKFYVRYIGAMGIFLLFLNTSGLFGIVPATKDLNVTGAFALMTFFLINANSIKENGLLGYLHGYLKPAVPMLPLNIIEKITIPLSLTLRLFINMVVGTIIIELVYHGLGYFAFLVPVPLHFFFDLFVGVIQTFVFMMLTMVYVKTAAAE